jgi:tetratricopeptide (TPR) repeat protein
MNKKTAPSSPLFEQGLGYCDLERPSKRVRAGTTSSFGFEIIRAMVDNGNAALKHGDLSKANACYISALTQIEAACTRRLSTPMVIQLEKDDVEMSSKPMESPASRRNKYDELMDVFQDPYTIDTSFTLSEVIIARLCFNVSLVQIAQDRFEEALKMLEKALQRIEKSALKNKDIEFQLLHKIGFTQFTLGNAAESLKTFEKASSIALQTAMDKVSLAACLNCLGVIHFHHEPKKADTAMQLLIQSLALYRQVHCSFSKEVATVLNNIGRVHFLLSQYDQALNVYNEALVIRVKVLGAESVDVAATLYNIGQSYHQLGQLDHAMHYYKRFLSLSGKELSTYSRDAAIVYLGIGEIYKDQKDMKQALAAFKQALAAQKASLGNYHLEVASTLNKLGNLCYEMQDPADALEFYKQGLEIEILILEPSHQHIIITLTNIAHIEVRIY